MRGWIVTGIGGLSVSCGLAVATVERGDVSPQVLDAIHGSSEHDPDQKGPIWENLEVFGLAPMWLGQGTPDGTGDSAWPDEMRPFEENNSAWVPPLWAGEALSNSLWMLDGMGAEPENDVRLWLHSRAAFVYDLDSGQVLLSQSGDDLLPVASLTKLISGLTVSAEGADLSRPLCLDGASRPSWPGAVTRLEQNLCTRGWDLIGAALVRSDNGAALAMADVAGLPYAPFVTRMNDISKDLGMENSRFTDPTGVEDTNLSTARDITRAVVASAFDPLVAPAVSAPYWDVQALDGTTIQRLHTTNHLHARGDLQVLAAKTGYTDTARHCFTAVVELNSGRRLALTTLGAKWSGQRWRDVGHILYWASHLSY